MASKTVLVIDANSAVRAIASLALTPLGVSVHCLENTSGAVQLAIELQPAIVVCAYELAEIDPIAFCRSLREVLPSSAKILMLTSHDGYEHIRRSEAAQLVDIFLAKPFKSVQLRTVIEKMLAADVLAEGDDGRIIVFLPQPLLCAALKLTLNAEGYNCDIAENKEALFSSLSRGVFKACFIDRFCVDLVRPFHPHHTGALIIALPPAIAAYPNGPAGSLCISYPLTIDKVSGALRQIFPERPGLSGDGELTLEEHSSLAAHIGAAVFERLVTGEALRKGNWKLAGSIAEEEALRACADFLSTKGD